MAEDLGRIRAGSATRTIRQITETLESETPDRDRLSLLRVTLQEKLDTIKTLDAYIVELIDDEAEEIEQADACKETMYEAILKVDRLLNNSPTTRTPVMDRAAPRLNRVKLPKLQLRSFNGDLTKWTGSPLNPLCTTIEDYRM